MNVTERLNTVIRVLPSRPQWQPVQPGLPGMAQSITSAPQGAPLPTPGHHSFRTGDIVLFAGRGLASDIIRFATRSPWSHVGMVVELPEYPEPLVVEATTLSESADVRAGHALAGVGLVPLATKVQEYPGDVAWRAWQGDAPSLAQARMLARMVRRLHGRPYRNYLVTLARELGTGFRRRPDLSGLFCSELVAELYRRLGWLPRTTRPSRYVPGHFASDALTLCNGSLASPQLLKQWAAPCSSVISSAAPAAGTAPRPLRTGAHGRLLLPQ